MKREIKFRAWDDSAHEMMNWDDITSHTNTMYVILQQSNDTYHLTQYTGRKDTKGVDIYEGDIIHMFYNDPLPKPHIVVWHEYSARFMAIHLSEYNKFLSGQHNIYFANTGSYPRSFSPIIIGNIYEHPHLLTPTTSNNETK